MAGRPTKLNDEVARKVCKAIKKGVPEQAAATAAGISYSVHKLWKQTGRTDREAGLDTPHSQYLAKVERAVGLSERDLVLAINKHGKTDWKAKAWILQRRFPERWKEEKTKVQVLLTPASAEDRAKALEDHAAKKGLTDG